MHLIGRKLKEIKSWAYRLAFAWFQRGIDRFLCNAKELKCVKDRVINFSGSTKPYFEITEEHNFFPTWSNKLSVSAFVLVIRERR